MIHTLIILGPNGYTVTQGRYDDLVQEFNAASRYCIAAVVYNHERSKAVLRFTRQDV